MFKQSFTNLSKLPKQRVRQWLSTFETIICDADGVLWHFNKAIEGAPETFNLLKASGRRMFVVTNNSGVESSALIKKARSFGIELDDNHMLTSAMAIAHYLGSKKFSKKAYIIGEPGINHELSKFDICSFAVQNEQSDKSMLQFAKEMKLDPEVGAVIVAKDDTFNVQTIMRACAYLLNNRVLFLGTCLDGAYPIGNNRVLVGAGAMIAAIKTISGRKPLILGKPNPMMVNELRNCGHINPETTLMIGDTLKTDILFAHNSGFQSLFVGTGVSTVKDVEAARCSGTQQGMAMVPDTYLPSLVQLQEFV
ncbi:glycerol-3-phosphate phosphatase [Drosophila albomicans]|uniref:Glycerol-3-phosphate phosphatase n=1 Tax=Drosophila albomicans TaxID=7291 RepID=A0A6P8X1H8_DROAB|nr:glycerol-3-phosphate phosphatase [Drosophila albomicans]